MSHAMTVEEAMEKGHGSFARLMWQKGIQESLRNAQIPMPWRERLTDDEKFLVTTAQFFDGSVPEEYLASSDGKRLLVIAKMAQLLDEREYVKLMR